MSNKSKYACYNQYVSFCETIYIFHVKKSMCLKIKLFFCNSLLSSNRAYYYS